MINILILKVFFLQVSKVIAKWVIDGITIIPQQRPCSSKPCVLKGSNPALHFLEIVNTERNAKQNMVQTKRFSIRSPNVITTL